jgi:23S rRNA (guanosine2251-2'-O)-methyltransferase
MAKTTKKSSTYWLYGRHAVRAACDNPNRVIKRLLYSGKQQPDWARGKAEPSDNAQLERIVGREAVHQGVVAEVDALAQPHLEELLPAKQPLLLLDQVTDPHNIGAMLRTAAAFGFGAVVLPKDGAPGESAVMAKAACGALERVPMLSVTNLTQAMKAMKSAGYWLAGMDGTAREEVRKLAEFSPLGLVMGAEGAGLRRLTAESCDLLVNIPIAAQMESLNVSNAAAIAMFVASGQEPR